ncbi:ankyrin repeat-containing domain protein [Apiospora arundinis]
MAELLNLPIELFLEVFDYIHDVEDLSSLARTHKCFYDLATNRIWNRVDKKQCHRILMWACAYGAPRALTRLLKLGFTTNLNFQLAEDTRHKRLTPKFYLRLLPDPYFGQTGWISSYACMPDVDVHFDPIFPLTIEPFARFWKPLHVAAHHGHSQIVEILLQHGAWVDATSRNYCTWSRPLFPSPEPPALGLFTPLHAALCNSQERVAQILISRGASMYVDNHVYQDYRDSGRDRDRITALHLSARYGLSSTAKLILEQRYETQIDRLDELGVSSLMYAYSSQAEHTFNYLLAQGASPRITGSSLPFVFRPSAPSILHQACIDFRLWAVVQLVENGSDILELDGNGDLPLLLIIESYTYTTSNYLTATGRDVDLMNAVQTIESCGMHLAVPQRTLAAAAKLAIHMLETPLLSKLLDYGLAISTTFESDMQTGCLRRWKNHQANKPGWDHRYGGCCCGGFRDSHRLHKTNLKPGEYDADASYTDTGRAKTWQTLLEYVCYRSAPCPALEEVIELLLDRGCIKPGDTPRYVRALKNLLCNRHEDDRDGHLLRCVEKICSHLSATFQNGAPRPQLPADLLHVVLDRCQPSIVVTIFDTFDFHGSVYSEDELWSLLLRTVQEPQNRFISESEKIDYVQGVLWANQSQLLLRHERTFEKLCTSLLRLEGGEEVVLNYLDRGGRYCLTFEDGSAALFDACITGSLQLATRLLDLGADPNNLALPKTPRYENPWNGKYELWAQNLGDVDILRLLIERGGNPFRTRADNTGIGFPFQLYLEQSDAYLEFFKELCRLTINEETNEDDLLDVVELACVNGRSEGIEELWQCAPDRVDTVIEDNATRFLQKLLSQLYALDDDNKVFNNDNTTVEDMDGAINTIRLLLDLGPPTCSRLVGSWKSLTLQG